MSVEDNIAVIRRLEAALNSGRVDAGLDLFAEETVYNGQRVGREFIRRLRAPLWAAVPDVRWTLEDLVAAGDRVATFWTVTGTHTGEFAHPLLGLGRAPASGRPIRYGYAVVHRLAGGRIAETRDVSDRLTLLRQLGVLPAPDPTGA